MGKIGSDGKYSNKGRKNGKRERINVANWREI